MRASPLRFTPEPTSPEAELVLPFVHSGPCNISSLLLPLPSCSLIQMLQSHLLKSKSLLPVPACKRVSCLLALWAKGFAYLAEEKKCEKRLVLWWLKPFDTAGKNISWLLFYFVLFCFLISCVQFTAAHAVWVSSGPVQDPWHSLERTHEVYTEISSTHINMEVSGILWRNCSHTGAKDWCWNTVKELYILLYARACPVT